MDSEEKIDVSDKIVRVCKNEDKKIIPYKNQVFETLRNECLSNGKLFEDPLFPATDKSMFYTQSVPAGTKWKRPKEISSNPTFIVGTANANDLDQGYLGNCWFIAGCSGIALVPELFNNVVPSGQSFDKNYAGIFHFRFWYYGDWVDVVVDDRLPVSANNRLLFCSNKQEPDEFWAALLEKAYAKLALCYENLDGGNTTDALIDMTGGIAETFEIKNKRTVAERDEIWQVLIKSRQHKSLIGASIAPNPRVREARLSNGLVMGHAYTVTKVACIEKASREIKLIRVRNPWGNEIEWKGAWSDNSYEWFSIPNDVKTALEYRKLPDGEFWMNYEDFYQNFETVQFCDLTPDAFSTELLKKNASLLTWKLTAYHGAWEPGKSSGGSGRNNDPSYWTNPQFLITLTDQDPNDKENMATIIISLLQKYTREKRSQNNGQSSEEYIQFRLYRILNQSDADQAKKTGLRLYASQLERVSTSGPYINQREITHRYRTKPGNYLIIPSTYDANVSGQFLLRLYTENPIGEQNCSILHDHKNNLDEKDLFFQNPKSIDDAFSNWTNLLGDANHSDHDNNVNSLPSKLRSTNNENQLNLNGVHIETKFSELRIYHQFDSLDFIWSKVEVSKQSNAS